MRERTRGQLVKRDGVKVAKVIGYGLLVIAAIAISLFLDPVSTAE